MRGTQNKTHSIAADVPWLTEIEGLEGLRLKQQIFSSFLTRAQ